MYGSLYLKGVCLSDMSSGEVRGDFNFWVEPLRQPVILFLYVKLDGQGFFLAF